MAGFYDLMQLQAVPRGPGALVARVAAWWARWQGRRASQEVPNPSNVAVIDPSVRKMSTVSVKTQGKSLREVG